MTIVSHSDGRWVSQPPSVTFPKGRSSGRPPPLSRHLTPVTYGGHATDPKYRLRLRFIKEPRLAKDREGDVRFIGGHCGEI
jgi:hypothetical protein